MMLRVHHTIQPAVTACSGHTSTDLNMLQIVLLSERRLDYHGPLWKTFQTIHIQSHVLAERCNGYLEACLSDQIQTPRARDLEETSPYWLVSAVTETLEVL